MNPCESSLWALALLGFCSVFGQTGVTRTFFIGIREEYWDYAPGGFNQINGRPAAEDPDASVFLVQGPHRIGHIYKKAVFRQYTNASYTTEIPKPAWLGYLGPFIRAEVGDIIQIRLKNFASRRYSVHPHGVFYKKNTEGALYPDGTSGADKKDDGVPPGGSYIYNWTVKANYGPTDDDSNCLTWAYHSHVMSTNDIASGLIGALLTCKNGILKNVSVSNYTEVQRTDVDQDFLLLFNVVDENKSWYLQENIETFCSDPAGVDPEDPDFEQSNMMSAINGYVYGNLPGITLCQNKTVSWHFVGMSNEIDVHSVYFHGQTLLMQGHRVDTISLFPAIFANALMTPMTSGTWLLSCQVNSHMQGGMQALFGVSPCGQQNGTNVTLNGTVRDYFIAAEKIQWNYAPSGMNLLTNVSLNDSQSPSEMYFGKNNGQLGGVYWKAVFRAYTDQTFTSKMVQNNTDAYLGIMGPILRAEVGDILQVTFLNKADRNYSIQPHGFQYMKEYEGAQYDDGTEKNGSHVQPGETFTYRWQVREGPSESDPPCIPYLYFSSTDAVRDTSSGLVGPLLVCRKGALNSNNTEVGVDQEFFLLFSVLDENLSWYIDENINTYGSNDSNPQDDNFIDSNQRHAVNGYMYGNLPGLDICMGARVRWYLLGLGTEVDVHSVYFQGNTFSKDGNTRDTTTVFPHTTSSVFMQPDTAGLFDVGCRVSEHYTGGMIQQYNVRSCEQNTSAPPSTPTVQYFIAAVEVVWNYSPNRTWELQFFNATPADSPGSIYVSPGVNSLGPKYKKVVYREYTDATFKVMKQRSAAEAHLEILGPIIRAEVGDVVQITFLNNASRPYSMKPHAVKVFPTNPAPVPPGNITKYLWSIPARSGPGASDPNCISFAYYSSVDFVKDTLSGLIGPLVICRNGTLSKSRKRLDVDREFALLFLIFNENLSWYLQQNVQTFYNSTLSPPLLSDPDFQESNKKHSINGKVYGNLLGLNMWQGENVVWYILAMGSEVDIHTVHLHGQTFIYKTDLSHRADVYDLFPSKFQTLAIVPDSVGTWLLHCHVSDHMEAGMETVYTVQARTSSTSHVGQKLDIFCIAAFISIVGLL